MHPVGRPALVLATASALIPTLLILLVVVPSFVPIGFSPGAASVYGLVGAWLVCAFARAVFSSRFTALERGVVEFWAHTLLFILMVATVLGALPLLLLPALAAFLGWHLFNSALYLKAMALVVLLLAALLVWAVWRRHWASLVSSPEGPRRAA